MRRRTSFSFSLIVAVALVFALISAPRFIVGVVVTAAAAVFVARLFFAAVRRGGRR